MFLNFRKKCINIGLGLLIVFIVFSCKENRVDLVKNGKSEYAIVIPDNASESIDKSADVLNNYLQKISTVNLPVINLAKANKRANKIVLQKDKTLNTNAIQILNEEDDILIIGGSEEALQNAVYVFLEEFLEVKWYAPKVDSFKKNKNISLPKPLHYTYEPEISTRTVHSRLFYENPDFAAQQKVTTLAFPHYVPSARVHTFHKFIPEEKFFKKHPEYFALRNNVRTPTQLCLTNSEVLQIVKDSVASLFKQFPKATVISVSQDDNQQYCQCVNCAKIDQEEGSPAGKTIRFVNAVAESFPNKTISTLAYQHTRKPPKTKPRENVLITLCSIECDRSAPIEEKCTDFAEDLVGWGKLTNNIRIWDYTTQFTNFLAPFPNLRTLQPNIQFFRDQHTKWVFEQHSNNPSELFELRSYLTAKLLWNPDLNFQDLLLEFTDGYYQEAGVFVRKYIELVHDKIAEDGDFFLFLYGDPSQAFDSFLNAELLQQYNTFFDQAEQAVMVKPEVLQRVKLARLSVDYAILEACKKNISKDFILVKEKENGNKEPNGMVLEKLDSFLETCANANITLMNEMGFTVEEYGKNYKNALQVAVKPNKAKGKKVTLLSHPKKYANEDPQVLTDGALGGNSFYANWLGFEGNNLEAIIDLEKEEEIHTISIAFLQVTNHVVFFPNKVSYFYSNDGKKFKLLGEIVNDQPLTKKSKVNDIKYFDLEFPKIKARYIKIVGKSMLEPPYWHHAAGTPSWIFADEVIID